MNKKNAEVRVHLVVGGSCACGFQWAFGEYIKPSKIAGRKKSLLKEMKKAHNNEYPDCILTPIEEVCTQ